MYLRSLTLKGFKSFADRTALSFDPGLNVVVGPNGSGKSNVSDSILWALGEQSAKMLRGQAMEDVIFSGSSARQAVGLAEVTLVLDNTDHTLPIDFSEVAVTRRMYRSGESEYLVNGSPSRLRDVQDILHDSGLGKDTHSIISQGKLDSVLSGRPEERRSLIEEAADIAKHRRRKERSQRRLASMDENLARAKVVAREIGRQLRPLERQVDRAKRARDLNEELSELVIQLAVDDLRRLKHSHEGLEAQRREAEAAVELAQFRHGEKSRELEKLQTMLEQRGLFVGDLGEQRRRVQSVLGRLDSDMRLLEEKGRNMVSRLSDMRMNLSTAERQRSEAIVDRDRAADESREMAVQEQELKQKVAELTTVSRDAQARRRAVEAQMTELTVAERTARSEADRETLAFARLEEQLRNADTEDQMLASRLAQLEETREVTSVAHEKAEQEHKAAEVALAEAQRLVEQTSQATPVLVEQQQAARAAEREADTARSQAEATLRALKTVDEQVRDASPLAAHLEHDGKVAHRLGDILRPDAVAEAALEALLGDDLAALIATDATHACHLIELACAPQAPQGSATLLAQCDAYNAVDVSTYDSLPGESLLAHVAVEGVEPQAVVALLAHVRLVADAAAALTAHAQHPNGVYVGKDGSVLLADGRLRVGTASSSETGSLERKRKIRDLEAELPKREEACVAAREAVHAADEALVAAREAEAEAKGELARATAQVRATAAEITRLAEQINRTEAEHAQVVNTREASRARAADARKRIEEHRLAAEVAAKRAAELADQVAAHRDEHEEAIREQGRTNRELSDTRLQLAMATERLGSLRERCATLTARATELEELIVATEKGSRALEVVRLRVDPLHSLYADLHKRAVEWAERLRDRASLAEADSDSLRKTIGEAKDAVSAAAVELERTRDAAGEIRVALGRLETRVEAAVDAICATGAVLDEALEVPAPENREATEQRVADLKSQIDTIGPVNEVAMEEYIRLRERADYIGEQVADLESARSSLRKITAAIDRKMRNRFLEVFEQVNVNFGEVFGLLFPGGEAHIELTDPDNPSETGIEIVAQPRGKRLAKTTLMSGGEKSLTALALLFAVYQVRTVPFYVFDEVEAALDDANLSRLLDAIERLKESTQLIVISHQRRTMEQADVLYGVSMQSDGVSRVVSQRLDRSTGKVVDA